MGKVWLIMLIASISTLLYFNPSGALESMLKGATSSVELATQLVAMYGFWLGFFMILEKTGISKVISKALSPLIRFLFKGASKEAQGFIAMNMAANLIGLGNAATPMGISAIKALDTGTKKANVNMIMLIVISSTSLQLLPTTVISMRAAHESANPANFLLPCLIATVLSTAIGITLVKIMNKLFPLKEEKESPRLLNGNITAGNKNAGNATARSKKRRENACRNT